MSALDGAFIKAYGRSDSAGETVEGSRPRRGGESVRDQLPSRGAAPSLAELYDAHGKSDERVQVHRLSQQPKRASEPIGSAASKSGANHDQTHPRLAVHTIVEADEFLAAEEDQSSAVSERVKNSNAARLSDGDLPAPQFIAIDEITRLLNARAAKRKSERRPAAPAAPEPEADLSQPWTIPVLPRGRTQAAFQVAAFAWPDICKSLINSAPDRFHALRDQLLAGVQEQRKVLGVAGGRPQAGTTSLVLALASELAATGACGAIFDADLVDPDLADVVAVAPQFSWHEAIAQELPAGECWIESANDRLTLIPLGKPLRTLERRLAQRLPNMMLAIRETFDFALVDLGSIHNAASGILSSMALDGLILVQDLRHISNSEMNNIYRNLAARGISCSGIIQNFV